MDAPIRFYKEPDGKLICDVDCRRATVVRIKIIKGVFVYESVGLNGGKDSVHCAQTLEPAMAQALINVLRKAKQTGIFGRNSRPTYGIESCNNPQYRSIIFTHIDDYERAYLRSLGKEIARKLGLSKELIVRRVQHLRQSRDPLLAKHIGAHRQAAKIASR